MGAEGSSGEFFAAPRIDPDRPTRSFLERRRLAAGRRRRACRGVTCVIRFCLLCMAAANSNKIELTILIYFRYAFEGAILDGNRIIHQRGMNTAFELSLKPSFESSRSDHPLASRKLSHQRVKERRRAVLVDEAPCRELGGLRPERGPDGVASLGNLNQRRWAHYRRWIGEGKYDRVWLLDVRDIVFQADPFPLPPRGGVRLPELALFADGALAPSQACLGNPTWERMLASGMPNLCGGSVFGTARSVASLADGLAKLSQTVTKQACTRSDRQLFNYHAFQRNLTRVGVERGTRGAYENFRGLVLTLGSACNRTQLRRRMNSSRGQLVNEDGSTVPILHRWDRCNLTARLVAERGLLYARGPGRPLPPAPAGAAAVAGAGAGEGAGEGEGEGEGVEASGGAGAAAALQESLADLLAWSASLWPSTTQAVAAGVGRDADPAATLQAQLAELMGAQEGPTVAHLVLVISASGIAAPFAVGLCRCLCSGRAR